MDKAKTAMVKILLIDDHPFIRQALRDTIQDEFEEAEIREAECSAACLSQMERFRPDVIVLDLCLTPHQDPDFSLLQWLRGNHPETPVLVLSHTEKTAHVKTALELGAAGFISKRDDPEHLCRGIRTLLENRGYLSGSISSSVVQALQTPESSTDSSPIELLSKREYEIFRLLGQGKSRKEIASQLHISLPTVQTHIERIKTKMDVDSGHKLLFRAIAHIKEQESRRTGQA